MNAAYEEPSVALSSRPPAPTGEADAGGSTDGFFDPLPSGPDETARATVLFERMRSRLVDPSAERDAFDRAVGVYFIACRVAPLRALIETEWAALQRIGEDGLSDEEAEHLRRYGIDPETGET